jgi:hypothetical protein
MNLDFSEVARNLRALDQKTHTKAEKIMDLTMSEAENYAKHSAPWRDRTGNARRSIAHLTRRINDVIIGVLGIGVYYGKYLELCNQGKYRIIRPTIDVYRNKLIQNLRTLL